MGSAPASHRIERTPPGPKAIARIREGWVQQRPRDLKQDLPDEASSNPASCRRRLMPSLSRRRAPALGLQLAARSRARIVSNVARSGKARRSSTVILSIPLLPCRDLLGPNTVFLDSDRFSVPNHCFHRRLCDRRTFKTGLCCACFGRAALCALRSGVRVESNLILLPQARDRRLCSTLPPFGPWGS